MQQLCIGLTTKCGLIAELPLSGRSTTIKVLPPKADGVPCFAVPVVIGPFHPYSNAVVVLAEARNRSYNTEANECDASGLHSLAMVRSPDAGATWEKIRYLYNDPDRTRLYGGVNLGAATWDPMRQRIHVMFNECVVLDGQERFRGARLQCGPVASLLYITSNDYGKTWSDVQDLTTALVTQGGYAMLRPGPGAIDDVHAV